MKLLNKIITDVQEWRCKVLNEDIIMRSRQFSDNTHHELKGYFHSASNCFTEGDKTIIVCCFSTCTNIVIFQSLKKNYEFEATTAYSS